MIRSMTGFGEAEHPLPDGVLRVQIKTVNHRFLNTSVRTPPGFDRVEQQIQHWIRPLLARGHASISITLDRADESNDDLPRIDMDRAARYTHLLRSLRDELELDGDVDLQTLMRFGDVFSAPESAERPTVDPDVTRAAVIAAAEKVVELREVEGRRLADDMRGRLAALSELVDRVQLRAPERLEAERDRLRRQVAELAGSEEIDDERLAREVAYLAEKWDVNEEIVRLGSHIDLFAETLEAEEPIGKRLAFVVQELHREANTIGSKANDSEISHAVVSMKEEIERLREQVENVE